MAPCKKPSKTLRFAALKQTPTDQTKENMKMLSIMHTLRILPSIVEIISYWFIWFERF